MKTVSLILCSILLSSCASMFNGERQNVKFRGGEEGITTKILTPDGTFEIENGSGMYMMTRSKSDIPYKIVCPDGSTKNATATTYYTWSLGWLNILSYGIGFLEAAMSDRAYSIDDVILRGKCENSKKMSKM